MHSRIKCLLLVLVLHVAATARADTFQPKSVIRQGRDLHYYSHPEGDVKSDYPPLTYAQSYTRDGFLECPPNPFSSFLGRGVNFLLLKLGAFAIVKAILTGLLFLKIPLFFLKMVFLKTFLFPVLIAPLLLHFFTNQQSQEMRPTQMDDQPVSEAPGSGMGRFLEEDLTSRVWRSMKVFAESEQCVERVACAIGAYTRDSPNGVTFSRALKLFERSSSSNIKPRMNSLREAFKVGVRNGTCSEQDFICHGPGLFIQQGSDKTQLI